MKLLRKDFLDRLRFKLLREPAGFGRPLPKTILDHEYSSGSWAHFGQLPEIARQSVVAGTAYHLHPHGSILDIGCGSGQMARLVVPFNPDSYVGIDLSSEAIRMARDLELPGCLFIEDNFETWRPKRLFDVILLSESIGYASDAGSLVGSLVEFLSPGGHLIVSYLRSGYWKAIWRRVESHARPVEHTVLSREGGQTWDIKVLTPHS